MQLSIRVVTLLALSGLWACQPNESLVSPVSSTSSARTAATASRVKTINEIYTSTDGSRGSKQDNYTYDAQGRLATYAYDVFTNTYDYSKPGQVTVTDNYGNKLRTYTLGAGSKGDLAKQVTDNISFATLYTFSPKDQLIKDETSSFGGTQITTYAYDKNDNLIVRPEFPGGRMTTVEYDLSKLNLRPAIDVENQFVGKGIASRNLLKKTVETTSRSTVTTIYTYEFNAAGYVTKRTKVQFTVNKPYADRTTTTVTTYTYE